MNFLKRLFSFDKRFKLRFKFFDELRRDIRSDYRIVKRKEMDDYLRRIEDGIMGNWLGTESYVQAQELMAARTGLRFVWAGADAKDMQRLQILEQLETNGGFRSRFNHLVLELIVLLQTPHDRTVLDGLKNKDKAREIGKKLCGMAREATKSEKKDLMQLFHSIIYAIDVDVARWLDRTWEGICGWYP
jgi:hypothetical protein